MLSKKLAALAAVSLIAASTAASAQSASSLSLSNSPVVERAGADVEGSGQLVGTTGWILGAVALGLVIWGIIEITSDGDSTSP